MIGKEKKISLKEDISIEEFMKILKKGGIKLKQLRVEDHSMLEGRRLKETNLPKNVLVGPLIKNDIAMLPDGNTLLEKNDILILLGTENDINITKSQLTGMHGIGKVLNFIAGIFRKKKPNL